MKALAWTAICFNGLLALGGILVVAGQGFADYWDMGLGLYVVLNMSLAICVLREKRTYVYSPAKPTKPPSV